MSEAVVWEWDLCVYMSRHGAGDGFCAQVGVDSDRPVRNPITED